MIARAAALAALLAGGLAPAAALAADAYRISIARAAPWAGEPLPAPEGLVGATLRIGGGAVEGPAPFACAPAAVETLSAPAEGLFEGGLPAPAQDAGELGLSGDAFEILRVVCPNASWDFVRADQETLLVALDGRILTLSGAPGALAPAEAPEAVVQRLLEIHYAGEMGFTRDAVAPKAGLLSSSLAETIAAYFAADLPDDEPPPVEGDPFTNAQEYPTRFAVGAALTEGDLATVEVRLADGRRERPVVYVLSREGAGWRVDDVLDEAGDGLKAFLVEVTP